MTQNHNTTGLSLREQVERMVSEDFYYIPLQLIKKAYPDFYNLIIYPDNYDFENDDIILDGMLYEAKNQGISHFLINRVNDLADIGIFLLDIEELHTAVFIPDTGSDTYEDHWIPFYRDVLKWVK